MMFGSLFSRSRPPEPFKTSPGKLKLYRQCPMKYKFIHVERRKGALRSTVHLDFDGILNKAVERYQQMLFFQDRDVAVDELTKLILNSWDGGVFDDEEQEREFRDAAARAAVVMRRWFAENDAFLLKYRNGPAIGVFAPFVVDHVTVWTRLDRVERLASGEIRVVDFKSGMRKMHPDIMRRDMGIRLQAAAALELFGRDVSRFAYVYLRDGSTDEIRLDELDLPSLPGELKQIAARISAGEFPPVPGPLCSVCEFMEWCRGWKEMPWKKAREDREQYQKRLRLSYSKMSLFERCPLAYRKLYVDGIPPEPRPFFSFGSCIHAVMESFYDKNLKRVRSMELLLELLEEKWLDFRIGYATEKEEDHYKAKARDMLEAYFNRFVRGRPFAPAAFIEAYFEMPVGQDAIMTGFIDRIDKLKGGGYIVLDYKTEPTDRTQEAVDADLQLTLYYWAAREFLGLNIRQLGLFMMSHDKLITTTRTPEDIPPLIDRINRVTEAIRNETEYAPRINKYCLSCDHLEGCPLEREIRDRPDLRSMEFSSDEP